MSNKFKIAKKTHGSYPSLNVIFSISTALFLVGLFVLFSIAAQRLVSHLKQGIEVQVFLEKGLQQEDINTVKKALSQKQYIVQNSLVFISKEEAAKKMMEETGEDFVKFVGENPLRDAFNFNLIQDGRLHEELEDLEHIPGVFEVHDSQLFIEKIQSNIKKTGIVIICLVVVFVITVIFLIHNAIRLALFSQRFLIRSMQLVGATDFFIKKPFLLRAAFHGMLGGMIASCILGVLYWFISTFIQDITLLLNILIIFMVGFGLVILGSFICYLSALYAVNKYLKMTLDELY
jgi:cell division transport system permease protein